MSDSHRGNFRPRGRANNNNNNDDRRGGRGGSNRQGGNQHDRRSAAANASAAAGDSKDGDANNNNKERPKRDNILDLKKYLDEKMRVKFSGGREVVGTLKGFDLLMNLVLDDVEEVMRDDQGAEAKRSLGLIVARGPLVTLISPFNGSEEIANPFVQADGDDDDDNEGNGDVPVMDAA